MNTPASFAFSRTQQRQRNSLHSLSERRAQDFTVSRVWSCLLTFVVILAMLLPQSSHPGCHPVFTSVPHRSVRYRRSLVFGMCPVEAI